MTKPFSCIHAHHLDYLDHLYRDYEKDPQSVDETFQCFFEGVDLALQSTEPSIAVDHYYKVLNLVKGYRRWGHMEVFSNPLLKEPPSSTPLLDLKQFGFVEEDLEKLYPTLGLLPKEHAPLLEIVERLKVIYCGSIGLECSSFEFPEAMNWIYNQMEHRDQIEFSDAELVKFYRQLIEAEELEIFINKTYPYITRFSIEGGESFVPMLIELVNHSAHLGVEEIVIGMAHRGRLNLLANVMKKPYSEVFFEFEPTYMPSTDVCSDLKYHNGLVSDIQVENGNPMKITLVANPSHLESVNPIIAGSCKARQHLKGEKAEKTILPVAIHGDASFAGQGVVYETMQLSRVKGFSVGGTVHIIVNNQIGYTAGPDESRSTHYATEIARGFSYPVLHVNGENIISCMRAIRIALEVRQRFGIDVIIDYNCYRRIGHNEADEVSYTHPLDYRFIKSRPLMSELFFNQLKEQAIVDEKETHAIKETIHKELEEAKNQVPSLVNRSMKPRSLFHLLEPVETHIEEKVLFELIQKSMTCPQDFQMNPKLKRIMEPRGEIIKQPKEAKTIDWGLAETIAFGSILLEGIDVRLSGQDSIRGTFSSRHAAFYDVKTQKPYYPLKHLKEDQGRFQVYNSILSEFAVLGFELGYSMVHRSGVTLWEAQYGDFFNGAQIIFDQYLYALYDKWEEESGLIVLLPHGMEGKGSEHSSARIERHLQSASKENAFICFPSTTAQYFHLIRRQALRKPAVPLIVFTPKSHLRFPPSFSSPSEFIEQNFREIIDDPGKPKGARRIILCSGHVYYDLIEKRKQKKLQSEIAIVRIEQLYPIHKESLLHILKSYSKACEFLWVQEEHRNQGAANYMLTLFHEEIKEYPLRYVGRASSPVPAAGYSILHKKELEAFLNEAIA